MPDETHSPPLSIVILGTDAVLAAAPATPVQLAHACLAAGFAAVIPASWGDELVATECLRRVGARDRGPVVCAVCPHVTERLLEAGADLTPFTVSLVAPPVAAARYLRAVCGDDRIRITFVGGCPGGRDEAIDQHILPGTFLAELTGRDILVAEQPQVFDSIIPPDRRRFQSLPGGVPTAESLWIAGGRTLIEVDDDDYVADIAQRLVSREHALLDIAPKLGCACSGAVAGVAPRSARVAVAATEPPRSAKPIMDIAVQVELVRPFPPATRQRRDLLGGPGIPPQPPAAPAPAPGARQPAASSGAAHVAAVNLPAPAAASLAASAPAGRTQPSDRIGAADSPGRRRIAGAAKVRSAGGALPTMNSGEGRVLPRAYVARRRTTGRTPPDTAAIPPDAGTSPTTERERPLVPYVEPSRAVAGISSRLASGGRRTAFGMGQLTRSAAELTRQHPGYLAALIGIAVLLFVLFGVAAGWWITGLGNGDTPTTDALRNERSAHEAETLIGAPAGSTSRTFERGGSVGPELLPGLPSQSPAVALPGGATPARRLPRQAAPGQAGGLPAASPVRAGSAVNDARQAPATREAAAGGRRDGQGSNPPAEPRPAQVPNPADSSAERPAVAAVRPPLPSRRDSIDRELQAIARELEVRRARIDSISRRNPLRPLPPR